MWDVILDLYRHMEWADAEHWRAVMVHPAAREDRELRERLLHIHGAQEIWLGRWQGLEKPLRWPTVEDYPRIEDLRHYAAACHAALRAYLPILQTQEPGRILVFTTLQGDPVTQPLADTLLQLPMHSQYHRAQNATRMRVLGGHMPQTDWAYWTRRGRPVAHWV